MEEKYYRRAEDKETRLLAQVVERISHIQKTIDEKFIVCAEGIKNISKAQQDNPCDTHGLRINNIEKVLYGIIAAIALLMGRLAYVVLTGL